jgi:signal transduction histidine kinase
VCTQLDVTTTLCKEVCDSNKAIIIEHASAHPFYASHHTPKLYKIESYIAIPILRPDGQMFGTLCAIDSEPAKLDPKVITSLTLFTELISSQLRAEDERAEVVRTLWDERKLSQLREQFIAVLGHDLRTPLGGIVGSTDLLLEELAETSHVETLQGIQESTKQMSRLIEDVLDFARGRLGGGIHLTQERTDISPLVKQTIEELSRAARRGRSIRLHDAGPRFARVDVVRFRQVLSNVIGNALQHSPEVEPVDVKVDETAGLVRIAVKNGGPPIPAEIMGNLFSPFHREVAGKKKSGLGLGLYIASEIVRAHDGNIQVNSDESGTTFTLLLPGAPKP